MELALGPWENRLLLHSQRRGIHYCSSIGCRCCYVTAVRHLAIGIGIQNFPEGLAVSLPLKGLGYSSMRSFWYGQLSGMVEPIAGVLGAIAVQVTRNAVEYVF